MKLASKEEENNLLIGYSLCCLSFLVFSGVHILQTKHGCEWDDETGEVSGYSIYGYEGEDFISLNVKNKTWTALKPQAVIIKQEWDADETAIKENYGFLTHICPEVLKTVLKYHNGSGLRKGNTSLRP